MYVIEIFKDGEWQLASKHSREEDRDEQYKRFVEGGIPSVLLRYVSQDN